MMDNHPPKTLQILIKEQWLVESIRALGSGYYSHLAYPLHEIEPDVGNDIQNPKLKGVLGEIINTDGQTGQLIATVEVERVNHFQSFIRFDFRILEINPFIRDRPAHCCIRVINPNYLCYYL